jgi:hypothetical protein
MSEKIERDEISPAEILREKQELTVLVALTRANAPVTFSQLRRLVPVGIDSRLLSRILLSLRAAGKATVEGKTNHHSRRWLVQINPDRLQPWQQPWNGKHWYDMPGQCEEMRKLNFYLFRNGLDKYIEAYFEGGAEAQRKVHGDRTNRRLTQRAMASDEPKKPRVNNGFQAVPKSPRQAALLERYNRMPKPWGWGAWFESFTVVHGETLSAFKNDTRGLTASVMDRIERGLDASDRGEAVLGRRQDRPSLKMTREEAA